MERLVIIAIIIAAIVIGGDFLMPIAISALLAILISAGDSKLRGMGLPGPVALTLTVLFFAAGVGLIIYIILSQVDTIREAWPQYIKRLSTLVAAGADWLGPDVSSKLRSAVDEIDFSKLIPTVLGSAGSAFTTIILILLYTGFMLGERTTVGQKVRSFFNENEKASKALEALERTSSGMRDYIWVKSLMSALTAGVSYVILKALNINFSETWAVLIFFLNFIPSIGSVLGAVFPAILALVQFDTLWQFLVIAVVLSSIQFSIGNILEPRVMGKTLNLSPFVVMASLTFWTMAWGIVGAFLSVPLTAAVVIICSRLQNWRWLAILLSEDGTIPLQMNEHERAG